MNNLDGLKLLLSKLFCWSSIVYRSVDLYDVTIAKNFGQFVAGTLFKRINFDLENRVVRLFNEKDQLTGKFMIDLNIVELKSDRVK